MLWFQADRSQAANLGMDVIDDVLDRVVIDRFLNVPGRGLIRVQHQDDQDPPPPRSAALDVVYSALRNGDIPRAEAAISELDQEGEDRRELFACRVFGMMLSGDISTAHMLLKEIDEGEQDDDSVLAARAAVLLVSGDSDDAARLLDKILEMHPRHELGRYLYSLWRAQSGELQIAHDVLVGLCRDYPDHALARLQLGQVLMAAGDIARAGTLFEAAIDQAPNLVQAWERFSALLVIGGQPQEAMMVAKRGLSEHPGSRSLLEVLARSALAIGASDIALDSTRLVLATALNDPVAHANHAVALTAAGQHPEALRIVREAAAKFPDDSSLQQLVAEIESVHGRG